MCSNACIASESHTQVVSLLLLLYFSYRVLPPYVHKLIRRPNCEYPTYTF